MDSQVNTVTGLINATEWFKKNEKKFLFDVMMSQWAVTVSRTWTNLIVALIKKGKTKRHGWYYHEAYLKHVYCLCTAVLSSNFVIRSEEVKLKGALDIFYF